MMRLRQRINAETLPTLLAGGLLMLATPLERASGMPSFLTALLVALGLLAWSLFYGINACRRTAQVKRETEAKYAALMAQLYDGKTT